MPSRAEKTLTDLQKVRRNTHLALLVALASAVHTIEAAIPTPVPWLKFGFANILTITAISLYDLWAGLTVAFIRVMVGSMIIGTFLTPSFFIGLSGGIASAVVMGVSYRFFRGIFSLVGISVLGAYASNLAQIATVYAIFIRHTEVFMLLPVFLGFGLVTGIVNGIGADFLVGHIKRLPAFRSVV
jgi:heptaprenyl diphosphate synthase